MNIPLGRTGIIGLVLLLDSISELIKVKRLVVLLAIIQRLAEREAKVKKIDAGAIFLLNFCTHRLYLAIFEAKRFQVGQAPVTVPEIRSQSNCLAVSVDRFILLTDSL